MLFLVIDPSLYFIDHKSWAGLAAVGIFLGYERWRRWYAGRQAKKPTDDFKRSAECKCPVCQQILSLIVDAKQTSD